MVGAILLSKQDINLSSRLGSSPETRILWNDGRILLSPGVNLVREIITYYGVVALPQVDDHLRYRLLSLSRELQGSPG